MTTVKGKILTPQFFLQDTISVARGLLGCLLVAADSAETLASTTSKGYIDTQLSPSLVAGRIVETEAYLGYEDSACHSYNKKPGGRTNIMFGVGGKAYIYLIYGLHYCLNAVTRGEGEPEGVLLRALQPLDTDISKHTYSGPGKLCRAMGINKDDYGSSLTGGSRLAIIRPDEAYTVNIGVSSRVGVQNSGKDALRPYRFFDKDSQSVSKARGIEIYS